MDFHGKPGTMTSFNSEEDSERFYDTREEITSISDSSSEYLDILDSNSSSSSADSDSTSFRYELWIKKPASVNERRSRFFKWMGINLDQTDKENSEATTGDEGSMEIDRLSESSGAVLGNSDFQDEFSSSQSSRDGSFSRDGFLSDDLVSEENFECRIKNLDDGTEFIVDELGQDGMLKRLRQVGSNRLVTVEEFQRNLGLSSMVQRVMRRGGVAETSDSGKTTRRASKGWLKKLGAVACIVNRQGEGAGVSPNGLRQIVKDSVRRVGVRARRKPSKELSALYMGQQIQAHDGSILSMKFSPDGKYLASAGEDGIVRVWEVLEVERSSENEVLDTDPSCMYFKLNSSSELSPVLADKKKMPKYKSLRKVSDSACVILPPKVFRLSEKPLHEFHGHSGEVLDLCWSNKYLLSCSVDNTVRLWKVGSNQCLKIFSHNNYVTSVNFNPVDDNYFISGSIDGKVRIWSISDCQVIDWTDIKEIVTAVCYRPTGQGIVVGSMTGNCYVFDASDNHLQLGTQLCLHVKKKSTAKRITGFQFSPSDPSKLMVTSADSHVRVLDGVDVICKFRGLKNAGSQISASFTSDGKHIVSASEDSNIYIWNSDSQDETHLQAKSTWSCERFISSNASVAIPWCGASYGSSALSNAWGSLTSDQISGCSKINNLEYGMQHSRLSSPDCFSLSSGFFSDGFPKGTATWPEEKLPTSNSINMSSSLCKSQYKFVKSSCESTSNSPHAWGMVIVTAGWDGCIRSFQNYGLPVCI